MDFKTLDQWNEWIASLSSQSIDLDLERVGRVAKRLKLLSPKCPVVTVAGTNGKGSCVAGLEAIYLAAGYKVGAFTSPFLFRFNEQIRISGKEADDKTICEAYEKIEAVRKETPLTPFEFTTLAAFYIFQKSNLDVWLLEVGLGGRLDAVNIIDPTISIVSSIGIDHSDWLGDTREAIGKEKAGIFRWKHPVICGDFQPPSSLVEFAHALKAPFFCQGQEFGFIKRKASWIWWSQKHCFEDLPWCALALQNMSVVLMAVELLQKKLKVDRKTINKGLEKAWLPGRLQVEPGTVTHLFDVSHNPAAVEWLADFMRANPANKKTHAVFSMLADKDILTCVRALQDLVDEWYVAPLPGERSASLSVLEYCFRRANIEKVKFYKSVTEAYLDSVKHTHAGDHIVVFGSFQTVKAAYQQFKK